MRETFVKVLMTTLLMHPRHQNQWALSTTFFKGLPSLNLWQFSKNMRAPVAAPNTWKRGLYIRETSRGVIANRLATTSL